MLNYQRVTSPVPIDVPNPAARCEQAMAISASWASKIPPPSASEIHWAFFKHGEVMVTRDIVIINQVNGNHY